MFLHNILMYSLSDCEEEPLVPGHVDAVQRQLALPVIGQVAFPGEGVGRVGLARTRMFRPLSRKNIVKHNHYVIISSVSLTHLYSGSEVEGDLDGAAGLVAWERRGGEDVGDPARARHGPRLDAVHLLAGRALDECLAGVVDEGLKAGPVVGVATLGQTEGGVVLLTQTNTAIIRALPVPGDSVEIDEVIYTGATKVVIIEG